MRQDIRVKLYCYRWSGTKVAIGQLYPAAPCLAAQQANSRAGSCSLVYLVATVREHAFGCLRLARELATLHVVAHERYNRDTLQSLLA